MSRNWIAIQKVDCEHCLPVYSLHGASTREWDHDGDLTLRGLFHSTGDLVLPQRPPPPLVGDGDRVVEGVPDTFQPNSELHNLPLHRHAIVEPNILLKDTAVAAMLVEANSEVPVWGNIFNDHVPARGKAWCFSSLLQSL